VRKAHTRAPILTICMHTTSSVSFCAFCKLLDIFLHLWG